MLSWERSINTTECKISLALVQVSSSLSTDHNWEENMLCTFNLPSANGTQVNTCRTDTAGNHVSTRAKHCVNLGVHADFALERVLHFGQLFLQLSSLHITCVRSVLKLEPRGNSLNWVAPMLVQDSPTMIINFFGSPLNIKDVFFLWIFISEEGD